MSLQLLITKLLTNSILSYFSIDFSYYYSWLNLLTMIILSAATKENVVKSFEKQIYSI